MEGAATTPPVFGRPGISIKLSALHPRYSRSQRDRVMAQLYPRVRRLAELARGYDMPSMTAAGGAAAATSADTLCEMPCFIDSGALISIECTIGAPQ